MHGFAPHVELFGAVEGQAGDRVGEGGEVPLAEETVGFFVGAVEADGCLGALLEGCGGKVGGRGEGGGRRMGWGRYHGELLCGGLLEVVVQYVWKGCDNSQELVNWRTMRIISASEEDVLILEVVSENYPSVGL